jgi:hypothetical protein
MQHALDLQPGRPGRLTLARVRRSYRNLRQMLPVPVR